MVALFAYLEKRPLGFALALAAVPYVGLRLYLSGFMHAEAEMAAVPGAALLLSLLVVGAIPLIVLPIVVGQFCKVRHGSGYTFFCG